MLQIKPSGLHKGDRFKFAPLSNREYTITDRHGDGDAGFWTFELAERPAVTIPSECDVYATQRYRIVDVPCLIHKDNVRMLHDTASGATPRAVICGTCDEAVTAEVVADMARLKADREAEENRDR
jgi:hypothetical protein